MQWLDREVYRRFMSNYKRIRSNYKRIRSNYKKEYVPNLEKYLRQKRKIGRHGSERA